MNGDRVREAWRHTQAALEMLKDAIDENRAEFEHLVEALVQLKQALGPDIVWDEDDTDD